MADRKQFTFYSSYYEAIQAIPKRDQASVLLAICAYALHETEPNLSGTAAAIFSLIRPTLDASKRKSENGKRGANAKQTASKPQANAKQNASESKSKKENKNEKENENEIENECYPPTPFGEFWEAYPKKKSKGDAEKAWKQIKPDEATFQKILASIERQKQSRDWQKDGGQYIPYPATWLRRKGWEDETEAINNGRHEGAGGQAQQHGVYL